MIPICESGNSLNPNDCRSLEYAVVGQKEVWIDYVMQYVAKNNNLKLNKDIKVIFVYYLDL